MGPLLQPQPGTLLPEEGLAGVDGLAEAAPRADVYLGVLSPGSALHRIDSWFRVA